MDFIGVIALKVGEEIGVIFGHGDGDLLLFVNKRYLESYCIEKSELENTHNRNYLRNAARKKLEKQLAFSDWIHQNLFDHKLSIRLANWKLTESAVSR